MYSIVDLDKVRKKSVLLFAGLIISILLLPTSVILYFLLDVNHWLVLSVVSLITFILCVMEIIRLVYQVCYSIVELERRIQIRKSEIEKLRNR